MKQGHPLDLVKRVDFPSTQFSCVFSAHAPLMTHTCSANAYAPLFSFFVVSPSSLGPHQSPIRIKVMGGSALWQAPSPPLATLLPPKTVGAMPCPRRAITDLVAP